MSESSIPQKSRAPTARFTDRVENYLKARPGYPAELIPFLVRECGLMPFRTVVDVGCGTGLLAERFCDLGCDVVGVEPNAAMREAGARHLDRYPNFHMVAGMAESLPVGHAIADFLTAGQAFHWFNVERAGREFLRVLKPRGWVVLVWNVRQSSGSAFAEAYEDLLTRFGIDYAEVHHRGKSNDESFRPFFLGGQYRRVAFPNQQRLDRASFIARVLSSSYMPAPGHKAHEAMMSEVQRIFDEHSHDGAVVMTYATDVIYGQLTEPEAPGTR